MTRLTALAATFLLSLPALALPSSQGAVTNLTAAGAITDCKASGSSTKSFTYFTGGAPTVAVEVSGTFVATWNVAVSVDKDTAFAGTNAILSPETSPTTVGSSGTTAKRLTVPTGSFKYVCIYLSAYTSGNVTVVFEPVYGAAMPVMWGLDTTTQLLKPLSLGSNGSVLTTAGTTTVTGTVAVSGFSGTDASGTAPTVNPIVVAGQLDGNSNITPLVMASAVEAPSVSALNVTISPMGDPCVSNKTKSSASISVSTATDTQLVALSGSTVVYVCGFTITSTGATTATTAQFEYGTGSSCATGKTALTGTMGQSLLTSAIVVVASGATQFKTAAANALCLLTAGTTPNVQGYVTYVQQ